MNSMFNEWQKYIDNIQKFNDDFSENQIERNKKLE